MTSADVFLAKNEVQVGLGGESMPVPSLAQLGQVSQGTVPGIPMDDRGPLHCPAWTAEEGTAREMLVSHSAFGYMLFGHGHIREIVLFSPLEGEERNPVRAMIAIPFKRNMESRIPRRLLSESPHERSRLVLYSTLIHCKEIVCMALVLIP